MRPTTSLRARPLSTAAIARIAAVAAFAVLTAVTAAATVAAVDPTSLSVRPDQGEAHATVVFLLRHAEKVQDGSVNPLLTPAGERRARVLADLLEDAGLTSIHSTPFARTRYTVAPLAERLGLPIEDYAPDGLEGLATALAARPGRHLVVGHSNTTPEMVDLLGGEPGPPIVEDGENDRLYVVTLHPRGRVTTVLLRYGDRFRSPVPAAGR
jgi:broad specificity phosphatase PhoE